MKSESMMHPERSQDGIRSQMFNGGKMAIDTDNPIFSVVQPQSTSMSLPGIIQMDQLKEE